MFIQSKKGFSLPEVLVALVIIGFIVTIAVGAMRNTVDDSKVIAALNQMNSIKEAAALFYSDFGCIPEEVHPNTASGQDSGHKYDSLNMNTEYATRFLCLPRDCSDSEIIDFSNLWNSNGWINVDDFRPGCYFMFQGLSKLFSERFGTLHNSKVRSLITDPVYGLRSWTDTYLEANSQFNATALNRKDDTHYPAEFYSDADRFNDDVFLPVISTPWADDLESQALDAESDAPALAAEYRKGKYYQILVYSRNTGVITYMPSGEIKEMLWDEWVQVPETAVVISRGPDGLPGTEGDDTTIGAEDYWNECAAMWQHGLTSAQRRCFGRLMITDPDDPGYVDIGDDLILFIFGGGTVRSPLDN